MVLAAGSVATALAQPAPASAPAATTITTDKATISVPNTIVAPEPAADQPAASGEKNAAQPGEVFSEVRVSPYFLVDIVAQNASLVSILQKLAIQSRRN
ncbi:MAG: hypothetical protein ACK58T_07665, partial [Phycisphaerae bacterium]